MITNFSRTHNNAVVARSSKDADFEMGELTSFKCKVSKLCNMLSTIENTTKALQSKNSRLSDSWANVKMLIDDINENKNNPAHKLCRCRLKDICITKNSIKHPNGDFARGVDKLQLGPISGMTEEECDAYFYFREEVSIADEEDSASETRITH